MTSANKPRNELMAEVEYLRFRLEEAEDTLRAIGSGEVDAFVVSGPDGDQVFTLKDSDRPYRVLVETMNEGAANLDADGTILYSNNRLAAMLRVPLETLIGTQLSSYVAPVDRPLFAARLGKCHEECDKDEIAMITGAGNSVPVLISCCAFDLSGSREVSMVVTDLTEQKRNEEIVATERLARSIIEQAGEAILVCDEGGNIIRASRLAHLLGGENPLLKPFDELFPLRITETECLFSVFTPLHGGSFESVEVEFIRSDDQIFHLILNATPLKSAQNGVIGCVVMLTDITERNKAERALQESETRLQAAYHHLQVNNEELQAQSEELQAQSEELQAQGEELQAQNEELARLWEESRRAEESLKKLNDELENRVAERTNELAATIENLKLEIVEREMAEERVLRLNRLYGVLSETNQSIVRNKDMETIFDDFCRIAVEHGSFKLAWVGLVDEESSELKIVAAKGATGYLEDLRITASEEPAGLGPTGISVREGTYFICNDFLDSPVTRPWHERGRLHGIRASASVAVKQEGRVVGALTLYADKKDFFDQQQVELLRQMGADISFALNNIVRETRRQEAERALREETFERLRTVEALREKEQMLIQQSRQAAMGEMISNIAHQWRQPLNALGLTVQQLLLEYDLGEFTREFLNHSVSSSMELVKHMSRTIDDFRNYFRPDKEKVEFKVREAIANTLSLLEGSLQNPRISVEIVAKDDPVIFGFQNEFAQVLLNILNNARDALTEREIDDPKVTITLCSEDGCAVVTVADNAGGVPEEIMDKIFDPYFTTKGPQRGTGVGLFMSKTIIENNMGGRLTVRNIANGAEFRIEVCHGTHL
jgi:PAS domain S-box-containing protein